MHADICGPKAHISMGGALYYLLFKDDHSGLWYIFCIAEKSEAFRCFQDVFNEAFRDTRNYMQIFRANGGGEFTSKKFQEYFAQKVSTMKSLHLIHRNIMVYVNGTIEQLWKVPSLSSTPVGTLWVSGLKLATLSSTTWIALVLDWFLEIHVLLYGMALSHH